MSTPHEHAAGAPQAPRRMTLSQVVEALLQRGGGGGSTVSLTRNAKGETQLEVVVRTSEQGDVTTIEEAEQAAQAVYDRLRERYPFGDNAASGSVT